MTEEEESSLGRKSRCLREGVPWGSDLELKGEF